MWRMQLHVEVVVASVWLCFGWLDPVAPTLLHTCLLKCDEGASLTHYAPVRPPRALAASRQRPPHRPPSLLGAPLLLPAHCRRCRPARIVGVARSPLLLGEHLCKDSCARASLPGALVLPCVPSPNASTPVGNVRPLSLWWDPPKGP